MSLCGKPNSHTCLLFEEASLLQTQALKVCGPHLSVPETDVCLGLDILLTATKTVHIFTLSTLFRFDTYRSKKESERLVQYLNAVPDGRILSVAVNDEGSRNLDDTARKAMTKLGSKHFLHLGFRYCP